MKAFVITIKGHSKSEAAAKRCIESGARNGVEIKIFDAITPADDTQKLAKQHNISLESFNERFSRTANCIAAFLSHFMLWKRCEELDQPIAIFEHDAILMSALPTTPFNYVLNIGEPSYGKFNTPNHLGVGPLVSKPYFPGAHAYMVNPKGARRLMKQATEDAGPTDIFLDIRRFPWLQEFYPWPARAIDSFTTIQNTLGCQAKHNYNDKYEISKV